MQVRDTFTDDRPQSPSKPPLQQPHVYLDLIDANERKYSAHLSTIAPYIQAAFTQWYAQEAKPALPDFLIHYFGRRPNDGEVTQIERLLGMRTQLLKDQEELKSLHGQAVARDDERRPANGNARREDSGHWSPAQDRSTSGPSGPNGARRSWASRSRSRSPDYQGSSNMVPIPEAWRRFGSGPTHQPIENFESDVHTSAVPPPQTATSPAMPTSRSTHKLPSGETYERLACVGEGTYGKVYKARNSETGAFVALKRIRMEGEKDGFPITAMREIKLLQNLRHVNVMRLVEMMVSKGKFRPSS